MRLQIVGQLPERYVDQIRARYPRLEIVSGDQPADGKLDVLLAWEASVDQIEAVLDVHPELPWVHTSTAGIPEALLQALENHPAVLTNGSGAHASPIAEYVTAVIISFYQRLPELRRYQERAEWAANFWVSELRGRTVGIIGLGDLGLAIARALRCFGVRLLGMRRRPEPVPEVDAVYPRGALHAFLAELDVLVLAAPLTRETRGLIGAAELARLKPGAYLVNVARGALVDEDALIAALRSGHLGGAALDVFTHEPLPPDSPLWRLPNVILTPHCCDRTEPVEERAVEIFLDNLDRFSRGEPLRNVVDRALGY